MCICVTDLNKLSLSEFPVQLLRKRDVICLDDIVYILSKFIGRKLFFRNNKRSEIFKSEKKIGACFIYIVKLRRIHAGFSYLIFYDNFGGQDFDMFCSLEKVFISFQHSFFYISFVNVFLKKDI